MAFDLSVLSEALKKALQFENIERQKNRTYQALSSKPIGNSSGTPDEVTSSQPSTKSSIVDSKGKSKPKCFKSNDFGQEEVVATPTKAVDSDPFSEGEVNYGESEEFLMVQPSVIAPTEEINEFVETDTLRVQLLAAGPKVKMVIQQ